MFKFFKPVLLWTALFFAQPAIASDLMPLEQGTMLQDTHLHTYTHILGLKPISSESYQVAKSVFLPDSVESIFGNYRNLDKNYNTGDCKNKATLFTVKSCTYPRAVTASSKCPFVPGYYKECACLPQFKVSSCPSPKYVSSPQCDGKGERCLCPSSVSLSYPNDRCTQYCDGNCVAKSCTPTASETGCLYGTTSVSNGCGGTRTVCKPCSPLSDQTGCQYGTYSCSNGCGGTRKCCSSCTPYSNETGCQYGTYSCSDGCGGTRTCCSSCSPASDETGCKYGTYSCSNGCGGTRKCCSGCNLTACSGISSKPANSYYTTKSCTDCSGTKTINSGWACNSGYTKSGSSCVKDCAAGGSASCSGQTSACSSSQVQTSSCKDCNGTTLYSCRNKTCADGGYSPTIMSGYSCSSVSYAGLSCYNCTFINCRDYGYQESPTPPPSKWNCATVNVSGTTCYTCTPK